MDHTTTLNKYLWAQNTISLYIFEQIFGEMAIHIFNKWENSNGNFLNFMTYLDPVNQSIIFQWVDSSYSDYFIRK